MNDITTDYYAMEEHNKQKFLDALKLAMPEYHIVVTMMDQVKANPTILFHVMKHMGEIANGTGYGQVHIVIEEGMVRFVRGEHSTKLNEPVIVQNQK